MATPNVITKSSEPHNTIEHSSAVEKVGTLTNTEANEKADMDIDITVKRGDMTDDVKMVKKESQDDIDMLGPVKKEDTVQKPTARASGVRPPVKGHFPWDDPKMSAEFRAWPKAAGQGMFPCVVAHAAVSTKMKRYMHTGEPCDTDPDYEQGSRGGGNFSRNEFTFEDILSNYRTKLNRTDKAFDAHPTVKRLYENMSTKMTDEKKKREAKRAILHARREYIGHLTDMAIAEMEANEPKIPDEKLDSFECLRWNPNPSYLKKQGGAKAALEASTNATKGRNKRNRQKYADEKAVKKVNSGKKSEVEKEMVDTVDGEEAVEVVDSGKKTGTEKDMMETVESEESGEKA